MRSLLSNRKGQGSVAIDSDRTPRPGKPGFTLGRPPAVKEEGGGDKIAVALQVAEEMRKASQLIIPIYTPATTGGELTKGDAWTDAPVPLSSSPTVEEDRWPRRINFGSWRGATL